MILPSNCNSGNELRAAAGRQTSVKTAGRVRIFWLALVLSFTPWRLPAVEQPLYTFGQGFDVASLECRDAKAVVVKTDGGPALRIFTGHDQPWPGVTLPAPGGHWDLSSDAELRVQLANSGTNAVTVNCRVDNPGADGAKHCVTHWIALQPGQTNTLIILLPHEGTNTLDGKLFGMRGYPAGPVGPDELNVTNVTELLLFVSRPTEDHSFDVTEISAGGQYTRPTAWVTDANPFFPFIDTFGQYNHKDWPGKVHSVAELQQRREDETADLAANPGPPGWDEYGGWTRGPQLKATGYFRTAKVDGKWWLVDPIGHLFWSGGIDCVGALDSTPVEERAAWFEDFPGVQAGFGEFLARRYVFMGHYAGRTVTAFSFTGANLQRKYGAQWRQSYSDTVRQRLRSWGLNTIGNWSDPAIYLKNRTPYTDSISANGTVLIEGSKGYWGGFPDVFDASFAPALRRNMDSKTNSSANDPWCIGYFCDNEMSWGDETSLSLGVLRSPAEQAAKREFVNELKAKYADIARLNSAWGTSYASWEQLLASREAPDESKAREDLVAFYAKLAETYFRTVRDTIRAVAPDQLYLGCRFAAVNDTAARSAGKYCDVVSYNLYRRSIADFNFPGGDKPVLVGEFHFGALDRGLFHPGLVPVENQQDRAAAYHNYLLGALRNPEIVGTHWFQWQDEPVTGRVYDEENYQIGFVDVADTPYPEMIAASRDIGRRLYTLRQMEE
jgi:hypothetical protein